MLNYDDWIIHDVNIEKIEHQILKNTVDKDNAVVFDLDGTLFNVSSRMQAIIINWINDNKQFFNEQELFYISQLEKINVNDIHYDLFMTFKNLNFDMSSNTVINLYKQINEYWKSTFFSEHYILNYDTLIEGACDFINKLYLKGYKIIYLSGRAENILLHVTKKQLLKYNFPILNNEIILKSNCDLLDYDFKQMVFTELIKKYKILASFENEYINLTYMIEVKNDIIPIIVSTTHSNKVCIKPQKPIYRIQNYSIK